MRTTISTNAVTNAVLYPDHWKVTPEIYIKIGILLRDNCEEWAEYYKRELSEFLPEKETNK
jgi:hypothetical protein